MKVNGLAYGAEIMTVADVAEYLKCHPSTIYRLLKAGQIPAFRVGYDWRLRRSDIDRWIAKGCNRPTEAAAASNPRRRGRPKK